MAFIAAEIVCIIAVLVVAQLKVVESCVLSASEVQTTVALSYGCHAGQHIVCDSVYDLIYCESLIMSTRSKLI